MVQHRLPMVISCAHRNRLSRHIARYGYGQVYRYVGVQEHMGAAGRRTTDANVTGQGELQSAAEGQPIDGCDGRERELLPKATQEVEPSKKERARNREGATESPRP